MNEPKVAWRWGSETGLSVDPAARAAFREGMIASTAAAPYPRYYVLGDHRTVPSIERWAFDAGQTFARACCLLALQRPLFDDLGIIGEVDTWRPPRELLEGAAR